MKTFPSLGSLAIVLASSAMLEPVFAQIEDTPPPRQLGPVVVERQSAELSALLHDIFSPPAQEQQRGLPTLADMQDIITEAIAGVDQKLKDNEARAAEISAKAAKDVPEKHATAGLEMMKTAAEDLPTAVLPTEFDALKVYLNFQTDYKDHYNDREQVKDDFVEYVGPGLEELDQLSDTNRQLKSRREKLVTWQTAITKAQASAARAAQIRARAAEWNAAQQKAAQQRAASGRPEGSHEPKADQRAGDLMGSRMGGEMGTHDTHDTHDTHSDSGTGSRDMGDVEIRRH
jgi:hypothetical protein